MSKTPAEMTALLATELAKRYPLITWELTPFTFGASGHVQIKATLTIRSGAVTKAQVRDCFWPFYFFEEATLAQTPLERQATIIGRALADDYRLWMLGEDLSNESLVADEPVPPVPTPGPVDEQVRERAWQRLYPQGIPFNPTSGFYKEAKRRNLGAATTTEFDLDNYRAQGFLGGILVCKVGEWDKMALVGWL